MTEPPSGGADGTDGPVDATGPSAALHPLLTYDPDAVIGRMTVREDLQFAICAPDIHSATMNPLGDLLFADGERRYCFRFSTAAPGYIITPDDLRAAIRGDIDSVEEGVTRGENVDRYDRRVYTMAKVSLPRPSATPAQRGWATRRFNAWKAEQDRQEELREQEARKRKESITKADKTAWATLRRYLTEEQRTSLDVNDWFVITGSLGTRFRVYGAKTYGSPSGNVWWLDKDGKKRGQLCAHSDTYNTLAARNLPLADHILAQMLEIVTDEGRWMGIAHHLDGEIHPLHKTKYSARW